MSVTRHLASQQGALEATGVRIHYLGAGYPNPEVSDPSFYREQEGRFYQQLAGSTGTPVVESLRKAYGYTDTLGPKRTREVFAKVYGADFRIAIDSDHLVPSIGATGGIDFLCSLFESRTDKVAYLVDAPTYPGFVTRATRRRNASLFSVGMDSEGPHPEEMRQRIREARGQGYFVAFYYTVPDGHNPGGISFSQERRNEIYRVVSEENVLLVEDSPYGYISYAPPEQRPLPFMSRDPEGRVVHLFTASKIGLPGPRVGFVYAPGQIEIEGNQRVHLSRLIQATAASTILLHNPQALRGFEAYLHDRYGRPLPSLWGLAEGKIRVYRENRDLLLEGLRAAFGVEGEFARWTIPEAGFFSVITFCGAVDSADLAQRLIQEHRVTTVPMGDFYASDALERDPRIGKNQLRLAFSFTKGTGEARRREIEEAVAAFGRGVLEILKGR